MNESLRKVLSQLKVVLLFDKDFDFDSLSRSCDSFCQVNFEAHSHQSLSQSRKNFCEILSKSGKNIEDIGLLDPNSKQSPDSKELKALIVDLKPLLNDLALFEQELTVLEETVQQVMAQIWLLQTQIKENLQMRPVSGLTGEFQSGKAHWGLVNLTHLHSHAFSNIVFLLKETIKKVSRSDQRHSGLLSLGLPRLLKSIRRLVE